MTATWSGPDDDKLRDVLAYLCDNYPYKNELSKARLTKMVYLSDWRSALMRGSQITHIDWTFNHFGPYVSDVISLARRHPDFDVLRDSNMFGHPKEIIRTTGAHSPPRLAPGEKAVLDFVIESTSRLNWDEFISLVYSTYPIRTQPRYSYLDLPRLATEYTRTEQSD